MFVAQLDHRDQELAKLKEEVVSLEGRRQTLDEVCREERRKLTLLEAEQLRAQDEIALLQKQVCVLVSRSFLC